MASSENGYDESTIELADGEAFLLVRY